MLLDNQHIEDLIKSLHCSCSSCPNQNNYCYELDGIHLKITHPHLKTWSICINESTASLNAPSSGLIINLISSKMGTYNPLRSRPHTKNTRPILTPETLFFQTTTLPLPMPPFSQYSMLPPYYYQPYTPFSRQMHHSLLSTTDHLTYSIQFSDSNFEEQDPLEKLYTYFT